MATLMPEGKQSFNNGAGAPLVGGKVYTYDAGTSTPRATYQDAAGTIPNTNPVVLDARGEATIFWSGSYKAVLKDASDVTIWTVDNVRSVDYSDLSGTSTASQGAGMVGFLYSLAYGAGTIGKWLKDLATSTGASFIGWIQSGAGTVLRLIQDRLRDTVHVADFTGNDPTGATDSTAAWLAAQGTGGRRVIVPPGTYKLNGLRILNGTWFDMAGDNAVTIQQAVIGTPAINCLSDVTVGQLRGIKLKGFKVVGAVGATVEAVRVAAYGAYAIWASEFEFTASATFSALNIQGNDAANVFWCKFRVTSENTSDVSVVANGGVYNQFSFFLTQCYKTAYVGQQSAAIYHHLVTEGPIAITDQNSTFNNVTVENMPQFVGTVAYAISDTGFNNTWNTPLVIFDSASAAKVTGMVFKPFVGTVVTAPRFLMLGTPVANPFAGNIWPWTLIGPGQNGCTNKIETVYDGTGDTKNPRTIGMVNVDPSFTAYGPNFKGKAIQYLAPTGAFNFSFLMGVDTAVWEPSGVIAFVNVGLVAGTTLRDGQSYTFSSTQTVTTINWTWAGVSTLLPTTIAANTSFTVVYRAANNTWYRA